MRWLCVLLIMVWPLVVFAEDRWTDAHLHYVNFKQQSDGMAALLAAMDEAEAGQAWLFGLPVMKKWQADAPRQPRYYLSDEAPLYYFTGTDYRLAEDLMALPEEKRRRFAPFISGFNPTDLHAAEQINALIQRFPGLWKGIGEILTRHDQLTALTEGETPRANHPALMKVYSLAAKHDLPVLLHSNLTSLREKTPIYLQELEEAVRKHPQTRFVLAHAGTSGGVEERQAPLGTLAPILRALLERYDNFYVDLSWSARTHYLMPDGEPSQAWLTLINDFPERFILGTDLVGRFSSLEEKLTAYQPILDALPEEVAQKLARDNARALVPENGARPEN